MPSDPSIADRSAASSAAWQWRLRVYPLAVVAVLAAVVVVAAATDAGTEGEGKRLGGDYPAFYAAGSLAADGDWDRLYDAAAQQSAQSGLVDDGSGFLYFAYPPPVAAVYAPLSSLPYRWSYVVHTVLMGAALWGAVVLARPMVPIAARYPAAVFAALLLTYPLYRAVAGGQNTALTLFLIVAAANLDRGGRPVAAGLAVGLLFYKPQFAVAFVALLVVRRRWRSVAAAGGVAALMWVVSTAVMGANWLGDWWRNAVDFARLNAELNEANLVSLPGALSHLWGGAGEYVGWGLAAVVAAALAFLVWRRNAFEAPAAFALTAAATVLVLPQPLFYEAGLVAFGALLAAQVKPAGIWIVSAAALATWLQPVSGALGAAPLMLIVAAVACWSSLQLGRIRNSRSAAATS